MAATVDAPSTLDAPPRRQKREDLLANPHVRLGQWVAVAVLVAFFFFFRLFPAPVGVLLRGAINGSLIALTTFGIVLIYRAQRIINFAQGDVGAVAGLLGVFLIADSGLPFFLAMAVALVAAAASGVLAEVLFIRRFARAPRLIATVATLGVAQIFQGGQLFLPRAFGRDIAAQISGTPLDFFKGRIRPTDPIIFRGGDLLVVLSVVTVCVALGAFLRFTRAGIAIRGSAESSERAGQLGIPVKRLNTLVWAIAGLLSGLALFLAAPINGVPIGEVQGLPITFAALTAAVIARMESLPVAFMAAVTLGVADSAIGFNKGPNGVSIAIKFGVILAAFLIQKRQKVTRADESGASSWDLVKEVRPIPRELKSDPLVALPLRLVPIAVVVALIFVPLVLRPIRVDLILSQAIMFAILGISLVILTGWAGEISLGQIGFFGLGAAMAGKLYSLGWNFFICVGVAGLVGLVFSTLVGLPSLRIRGPFLAVATIGFAYFVSVFVLDPAYFPWFVIEGRVHVDRPELFGRFDTTSEHSFYYVLLIALFLVLASARAFRRSRAGRVLIAQRDNTRASQAYGVNSVRIRLVAFAYSGFLAAMAGGLFVFKQGQLARSFFIPQNSIVLFTLVVVGGLGSLPGAVLGAAYFTIVNYLVPSQFVLFVQGFGLLLILLALPGGFGGLVYTLRDAYLRWVARRRGIVVASLVADKRVAEEDEPWAAIEEDEERAGVLGPAAALAPGGGGG